MSEREEPSAPAHTLDTVRPPAFRKENDSLSPPRDPEQHEHGEPSRES